MITHPPQFLDVVGELGSLEIIGNIGLEAA